MRTAPLYSPPPEPLAPLAGHHLVVDTAGLVPTHHADLAFNTWRFNLEKIMVYKQILYISTSDFSKRTVIMYLKLEIRIVFREFLTFKYVSIFFSKQIRSLSSTQYPFVFVWAA